MKRSARRERVRRSRGRPPLGKKAMRQIALRLPTELLTAVDDLIADRLDRPDRSALIRELLAEAIEARREGRSRRR